MNVLVLGARIIGEELAYDLVAAFLEARFQSQWNGTCAGSIK